MSLLEEVVNEVREQRRRRRRRRWLLGIAFLATATTAGVLWESGGQVTAAVKSHVGVRRVERFSGEIRRAAGEADVDACLLAAMMYMESRGTVDARSSAGALGLMQLMPPSAADAARKLGLPEPREEDLLSDAELNIRLGAQHLAWLIDKRGDMDLEQVLVAYNAGRQKYFRWVKRHGSYAAWKLEEERLAAAGESNTGSLEYAREAIAMRQRFFERGVIEGSATD